MAGTVGGHPLGSLMCTDPQGPGHGEETVKPSQQTCAGFSKSVTSATGL